MAYKKEATLIKTQNDHKIFFNKYSLLCVLSFNWTIMLNDFCSVTVARVNMSGSKKIVFFLEGNNDINVKMGHHNCFSRKITHKKLKQAPGAVSGTLEKFTLILGNTVAGSVVLATQHTQTSLWFL